MNIGQAGDSRKSIPNEEKSKTIGGMGLFWTVMNGLLLEWILERDGPGLRELIQVLQLETEALQQNPP